MPKRSKERTRKPSSDRSEHRDGTAERDAAYSGRGNFDSSLDDGSASARYSSDSGDEELEQSHRRIKAAKKYLRSIAQRDVEDGEGIDAAELDRELIASRLKKESAIVKGKFIEPVASDFYVQADSAQGRRGHSKSLTAIAADAGDNVYTSDKSNRIIQWHKAKQVRVMTVGRRTTVLSLAVCSDGSHLASGHSDGSISIWDTKNGKCLSTFTQHRQAVLSLVFQQVGTQRPSAGSDRTSHPDNHGTLFSASKDRTIRLWTIDPPAYLDTLYGHQDEVMAVDTITKEQCISAGGRDGTVRLWKVSEESQLLFRPSPETSGPMQELVGMLDENTWITASSATGVPGGLSALSLWVSHKKKPVAVHGSSEITALCTKRYSDLVITGHADGTMRRWRADPQTRCIELLGLSLTLPGMVNDLKLTDSTLIAACGTEPRLGRWVTGKGRPAAANRVFFIPCGFRRQ